MDTHKEFAEWVVARGVKVNSIAAHRFPGRGLGIIAEKNFKARSEASLVFPFHLFLYCRSFFSMFWTCCSGTLSEKGVFSLFFFSSFFFRGNFNQRASDDDAQYHKNRKRMNAPLEYDLKWKLSEAFKELIWLILTISICLSSFRNA